MRHVWGEKPNQTDRFDDIECAGFYLGTSWAGGKKIFVAENNGGPIGITVSAWGSFLVTCRIIFKFGRKPQRAGRKPILYRYVDLEMAKMTAELMKWLPDKEERALISVLRQWRANPEEPRSDPAQKAARRVKKFAPRGNSFDPPYDPEVMST